MKYLITERQLKLIKEDNIRKIDFEIFNNDWDLLQKFLERRGNPPYIITGNLDLRAAKVITIGSLVEVKGYLDLFNTNIESLGNLQHVGGDLELRYSNIKSLGNLQYVGGNLYLRNTPLSKTTTEEDIRNQVEVGRYIYF